MNIIHIDRSSYFPKTVISEIELMGDFLAYEDLPDEEKIVERLNLADIAIVEWTKINKNIFERLNGRLRCLIVARQGYSLIDIQAAKSRGIVVCNTPYYSIPSVAEHVFALIFAVGRQLREADELVRLKPGKAHYSEHIQGLELYQRTMGIWGLGRVGSIVARIANGFGMSVIASDQKNSPNSDVEMVEFDYLLRQSDVFCICVDVNSSSVGKLNIDALSKIKKGAILINITDNDVLDEDAVASRLNQNELRGAAFDTTPKQGSPLLSAKNTFFTPDIAWYTTASHERKVKMIVNTIKGFIDGRAIAVVNP